MDGSPDGRRERRAKSDGGNERVRIMEHCLHSKGGGWEFRRWRR